MISIGLNEVKSGMTLAESAYNFQGVLLLDAGEKLSERSIRILKSWGVAKVSVEGESEQKRSRTGDAENRARKSIKKRLKERFADVSEDPIMIEIMVVAGKILEKRHSNHER